MLDLTIDELLTTTRSVRKRLDFSRPVEPEIIRECLELAVQAPTGGNTQQWQFVVVTDEQKRKGLGAIYRKGWETYDKVQIASGRRDPSKLPPEQAARAGHVYTSAQYLAEHMHEAPVLVVPCIRGRVDGLTVVEQSGSWGSILPAVWSFMLAARSRGLGTCWTTVHLFYEKEAADLLGIPFDKVMQTSLIPVAYTIGNEFKPGTRVPMDKIVHWEQW